MPVRQGVSTLAAALALSVSGIPVAAQARIAIDADPLLAIGAALEGPPGYLFQFIVSGAFLNGEGVVVADRGTFQVSVFDDSGNLVAESGGEGGGPAEFKFINRVWTRGDTVLVHDPLAGKIVRFSANGDFLSAEPSAVPLGDIIGETADGGRWISRSTRNRAPRRGRITSATHEIALYRAGNATCTISGLSGQWRLDGRPHPFSPSLQSAVFKGLLVVVDPVEARLSLYGQDCLLTRRISVPAKAVDFAQARGALEAELESRELRNAPPDLLRRLRDMPETPLPRLSHMLVDVLGRIWIKQYDPSEDAHWIGGWAGPEGGVWWLVDPTAGVAQEVKMPERVYPMAIEEDRLLGRHTDDLGVQRVMVYRIRTEPR